LLDRDPMTLRAPLVSAALAAALVGCSAGGEPTNEGHHTQEAPRLVGDYKAASDGPTVELLLGSDGAYAIQRRACDGCWDKGTFTYDGSTLTLTEAKTGRVDRIAVSVLETRAGQPANGGGLLVGTHPQGICSPGSQDLPCPPSDGNGAQIVTPDWGIATPAQAPIATPSEAPIPRSSTTIVCTSTPGGAPCAVTLNANGQTLVVTGQNVTVTQQ
jgi:hypothetical protein